MSRSTKNSERYRVPALEKGLDIIELLAVEPEGLPQSGVARALGRSVSEIYRMLACLVDRGYIALDQVSDRYVLTCKLHALARLHAPTQRLVEAAAPLLRSVARSLGQSCHLVIAEQGEGVVVAQADSPADLCFTVRLGTRIDLRATASGRVLLAFLGAEAREALLAGRAEGRAPRGLAAALAAIAERGHEEAPSAQTRGVTDLSFPVHGADGEVVAALTMPFVEHMDRPAPVRELRRARAVLADAARQLSARLGAEIVGRVAAKDR